MIEVWKEINGYEGKYQISNFGNVRGIKKNLLKCHINNWGYYAISFLYKNKRKTHLIHRLVAEHFIKKINGKFYINHIDGNKLNNTIGNLEWVTHKENVNHAIEIGLTNDRNLKNSKRMKRLNSENSHNAILREKDVLTIRKLYKTKMYTQKQLGEKYNVCRSTIGKIVTFKNWNKLTQQGE